MTYIPPKTEWELKNPAKPGQRHQQMLKVALSLLSNGIHPEAVFIQLRKTYASDVTDQEIWDVIEWAEKQDLQPSGYAPQRGTRLKNNFQNFRRSQYQHQDPVTSESAFKHTEKYLQGFSCNEIDLWEASPLKPSKDNKNDALMLLQALYDEDECINIIAQCNIDGAPIGTGETLKRDEWVKRIQECNIPECINGTWIRPNPVKAQGSGKRGAYCDIDVTDYRFFLLESDLLPIDLQMAFIARLKLPIAALIHSGGKSIHAWVKIDSESVEEYKSQATRVLHILKKYGFDQATKNPSRMGRFPGAKRRKNPGNETYQKLLYLNPEPTAQPLL